MAATEDNTKHLFSPDGSTLAVVSPTEIRLLSTATLETVQSLEYTQIPTASAYDFYAPLVWPDDGLGPVAIIPALETMQNRFQEPAQLWRLPLDGSAPFVMLEVLNRGPYLWVSPNLQHIVYSELLQWRDPFEPDSGESTVVQLLQLAATLHTQILHEGPLIDAYEWLPDGNTLFLNVHGTPPAYRLVNLLTGEWTSLPEGQEPEQWLDADRYLFRPTGNVQELWLGDRAGNQTMILRADGYLVHYWPWPDHTDVPVTLP